MPKIIAFIQARMSSVRLPGKVLMEIMGTPLIGYLVDQARQVKEFSNVVILTSAHLSDDSIEAYCKKEDISFFRGSLENVAERFMGAVNQFPCEYFVRLNADSPLYHREIMIQGVKTFISSGAEFVSNVNPRTYPKGMGFEMISSELFKNNFKNFKEPEDFEHVLKYFHRNKGNYKIRNLENDKDLSGLNFAVDTIEDFRRAEQIFNAMDKDHLQYSWAEYTEMFIRAGRML